MRTRTHFDVNVAALSGFSVGVIGLGKLGAGILHELLQRDWLTKVHAYSSSARESYAGLQNDLTFNRHKVVLHTSLRGLLRERPDLLFLTTGPKTDYCKANSRAEMRDFLYERAVPLLVPVFQAIVEERYQGLICVMTNPTGDQMLAAHRVFGIPSQQLTSFPPDTVRAEGLLKLCLENLFVLEKRNANINAEEVIKYFCSDSVREKVLSSICDPRHQHLITDIREMNTNFLVIGEHGNEIPIFDRCFVGSNRLSEIHHLFSSPSFREKFTNVLHGQGLRLMQHVQKWGGSYFSVPHIAVGVAERLARVKCSPGFRSVGQPIHCYHEELGAFLALPAVVKANPWRVKKDPQFHWQHLLCDQRNKLIEQARDQNQYLESTSKSGQPRKSLWGIAEQQELCLSIRGEISAPVASKA